MRHTNVPRPPDTTQSINREDAAHSVFSITFQDDCTILGYTSSSITDRLNDICSDTASEQSPGWSQAAFAAAHAARMSKTVRCLSNSLTREYARYYRDYLASGLTPSLTRHGRNTAHLRYMRIRLPKVRDQKPTQDVAPGVVAALLLHELNELERAA